MFWNIAFLLALFALVSPETYITCMHIVTKTLQEWWRGLYDAF